MKRRLFLERITTLFGASAIALPARALPRQRIELQRSPVAGFQYYHGENIWAMLAVGATVQLVREVDNAYDERAVRVDWKDRKLGYIPSAENIAISHLLDSGRQLSAEIVSLKDSYNPWERIELAVTLLG